MTTSQDRFYQLQFNNRNVVWGDIGSNIRIQGLVVGGERVQATLMLPGFSLNPMTWKELSDEEWNEFIRRADDPEVLIGPQKVFQRKVRWEISGSIQQKVWVADGFKCVYCGSQMGKSKMTIDHFIPLELGGKNDETNYLTSCASCNKKKANMLPDDWCKRIGKSPEFFEEYLLNRKLP
jgi:5-methylcytosine-specific restriction endonuclease McrA